MLYSRLDNGGVAPTKPAASPAPPTTVSAGFTPAPAPGPPPPGSVQTAPGYTPDYKGLIENDPAYLAANANSVQAQAQAAAQRKAALQQALIRYGGMPQGFTDQYGDIDQATKDAAAQNKNSILAQLANNYQQSSDQFKRGLAARGALQSGDLAYGADQLERGYGQQQYDAANQFGSDAQQAINAYTGTVQGNAQNMSQAVASAEANVYANPAYRPSAPSTANYDASRSSQYGQPIYVDDSGNVYDQNGNPFTAPSPSASASPYVAPTSGPTSLYQNEAALYGWL